MKGKMGVGLAPVFELGGQRHGLAIGHLRKMKPRRLPPRFTSHLLPFTLSLQQPRHVAEAGVGGVDHQFEQHHLDVAQVDAGCGHALQPDVAVERRA